MRTRTLPRFLIVFLLGPWLPTSAHAAFVTLSGTVTDQNGGGIFGVQINFVDACTGATAPASGNLTSSTGTFRATVNAGIYDLEFVPPAGSLFTAHRMRTFDLTASRTLAPVALPYGIGVSGRVIDSGGAGVPDVFARFFPPGSSERVFTVRDRTDASGNYSVVLLPGTYDVKYGPPLGTRHLGLVRPAVPIPGNTTLPTVALASGLLVSGMVFESSGAMRPVVNANIDAKNAITGEKLFLSHDRTDATGAYSLAVPAGTYVFDYKPEKCNLLVGLESSSTTVGADLTLPPATLAPGVLVRGTVADTRGAPVFDVNTNYIGSAGLQVFTFDDHTDVSGAYSAVVPPDTYNIDHAPPKGVRLAGVKLVGQEIGNAITLPPVLLPDAVVVSGRTMALNGAPLGGIDLDFFAVVSGVKVYTPHDLTDASGRFLVAVVPGDYDVRFEPPSSTTYAARRLRDVQAAGDVSLGDVTIAQGLVVTGRVTDSFGNPVGNADLDFLNAYTRQKAETLHDNTDSTGVYGVIVPPGLYDVEFVPPLGTPLETGLVPRLSITSDLSGLNVALRGAFLVFGTVLGPLGQGIAGADLDFYDAATGVPRTVSRDDSATDGTFAVLVPPGTYDIKFTPPSTSGLAQTTLRGVTVAGDLDLGEVPVGPALTPSPASISPTSGPASGGTAVVILGSDFQPGATCTLGGLVLLSIRVVDPGRIEAVTPGAAVEPQGALVDLAVTNSGAPAAVLPQSFAFTPAAAPVEISVSRAAPNIALSWPSTGQPFYTVYRSTSSHPFSQGQVLAITGATSFTDVGGDADGIDYYYRVE